MIALLYLYVAVMVILMIASPATVWKMRHVFSVKGGEPSAFYLVSTRIGGIVLLFLFLWYIL